MLELFPKDTKSKPKGFQTPLDVFAEKENKITTHTTSLYLHVTRFPSGEIIM